MSLVARPLNAAQRKPGLAFIPDRPVMRGARARADRCHCRNKTSNLINIVSLQPRAISAGFHGFSELTSLRQTSNRSESAATNLA